MNRPKKPLRKNYKTSREYLRALNEYELLKSKSSSTIKSKDKLVDPDSEEGKKSINEGLDSYYYENSDVKEPLKESDFKNRTEYAKARVKHNRDKGNWLRSNYPDQLPSESIKQYKNRLPGIERKRKEELPPLHSTWENVQEKKDRMPYGAKLLADMVTAPVDLGYYASNQIDLGDRQRLKTHQTKLKEDIDAVGAASDVVTVGRGLSFAKKGYKSIKKGYKSIKSQLVELAGKEVLEEEIMNEAKDYVDSNNFKLGGSLNDDDDDENKPPQRKAMTISQMMESGNRNFDVEPAMAQPPKDEFNSEAYKYAISQVESSGGVNMWNKNSSATGKYQFLYELIKDDSSMKGVTRREFMNRPELQEEIMDKALNGKLKGFTYGTKYAKKLKNEFKSDIGINQMTALVHFLGPGNARKFLADPENFVVPGVNLTGQQYIDKFQKHYETKTNTQQEELAALKPDEPSYIHDLQDEMINKLRKKQDNTQINNPMRKNIPEGRFDRVENSPLQPAKEAEPSLMGILGESNEYANGGPMNCGGPGQPPCDENYYDTIRNSRQGYVRKNKDGTESTHLMADNNKDKAFPTLFRNEDGSWDDFSNDHDAAFDRATRDNEIYSFKNKEDLFKFAREGDWKNNNFKLGGPMKSSGGANELVTLFEGGGTHEQNPLGGIPQGVGSNGKPNLVEEGETKWNDYIFSNSISLDGDFSIGKTKSNNYNLGGNLTEPTEPTEPTDPKKKKEDSSNQGIKAPSKRFGYGLLEKMIDNSSSDKGNDYPVKFNKRINENIPGSDFTLENNRPNWTVGHFAGPLNKEHLDTPEMNKVDWGELGRQTGAKDFLAYYNDPKQREMMKEQMGIDDEMYDNMVISGATAEMKDGNGWVHPEANAEYDHESHSIYTADKAKGDKSIERHERLHASGMDQAQGERLKKILGSAFEQGTGTSSFFKENDPNRLRYYNKESEMYGNFAEFRTRLGWRPGQKITRKELERLVKDKGLNTDEFYQIFDRDKLVKALNTVAYQDDNNNNNIDNYRIS